MGRLLLAWLLVPVAAGVAAQSMFDLPQGTTVGRKDGEPTLWMTVSGGSTHRRLTFLVTAPGREGKPTRTAATGPYKVTATKGIETHATFTVESVEHDGVRVEGASMLGLSLEKGSVVRLNLNYDDTSGFMLTVFDADIRPVFSRNMARVKTLPR